MILYLNRFQLLFGVLWIVLAGCMKSPSDKIEYGPIVDKKTMSKALGDAMGKSTPLEILKGDFVQTDTLRLIRGREVIDLLESVGLTVTAKTETDHQQVMTIVEEKITYDPAAPQDPPKKIIREFTDCINKRTAKGEACEAISGTLFGVMPQEKIIETQYTIEDQSQLLTREFSSPITLLQLIKPMNAVFKMTTSEEDSGVTYHKLSVKKYVGSPPHLVRISKDCGGIPECKINISEVQFDQVFWNRDGKGEKIHVKILTSQDVPYLAQVLEKCQQASVPIQKKGEENDNPVRLLVTFCETVRNFQKGGSQ